MPENRYIMQSNGGTTTFEQAKLTPVNIVESGPVAGVFGASILGKIIGEPNIIAFDVTVFRHSGICKSLSQTIQIRGCHRHNVCIQNSC